MRTDAFVPFGDLAVIGDGYDLLLQRLCYLYYTSHPDSAARHFGVSQVAAFLESTTPAPADRVRWWQLEQDGRRSYVCLNPAHAGHRETPPTDVNAVIEVLPVDGVQSILPRTARGILTTREGRRRSDDAGVQEILAAVDAAVKGRGARDRGGFVARLRHYSESIRRGEYRSPDEMQQAVNRVYEHGLFGVEVDCAQFSASIGMFELQAEGNQWIEQNWHERPLDYLKTLLRGSFLPHTAIVAVASHHFATGRKTLAQALDKTSIWDFQRDLYLALHHFWVANLVAANTELMLPFSRMVAEESLTCAIAGIGCGLGFFGRSFIDIGRELAAAIAQSGTAAEREFVHQHSSAFFPVIPRPLTQTILAFARVLSRPRSAGRAQELQAIAAAADGGSDTDLPGQAFTSFVRDYLLLNAARHLELENETKAYAARVMGRLVADRALA